MVIKHCIFSIHYIGVELWPKFGVVKVCGLSAKRECTIFTLREMQGLQFEWDIQGLHIQCKTRCSDFVCTI